MRSRERRFAIAERTYTHDAAVWVTHSTSDDFSWRSPYVLPVAGADNLGVDISSVVRIAGRIGVMWSNQTDWSYRFATHPDGAGDDVWDVETAVQKSEISDDHINLKALFDDPAGTVFAAVKTSLNRPDDPLVLLLVRAADGTWARHTVFKVRDNPTRPQVVVDPVHRKVHVLATIGPCCAGGQVNYKTADLDAINFPAGAGKTLLQSDSDTHINNVTSTKQVVTNRGAYITVYKKAADGSWKVVDDMTAVEPAEAPAAAPAAAPPAQ